MNFRERGNFTAFSPERRYTRAEIASPFTMVPQGIFDPKVSNWLFSPMRLDRLNNSAFEVAVANLAVNTKFTLNYNFYRGMFEKRENKRITTNQILDMFWKCQYSPKHWIPGTISTFRHPGIFGMRTNYVVFPMWCDPRNVKYGTCPNCYGCGALGTQCKRCTTTPPQPLPAIFAYVRFEAPNGSPLNNRHHIDAIASPYGLGDTTDYVEPCYDHSILGLAELGSLYELLRCEPELINDTSEQDIQLISSFGGPVYTKTAADYLQKLSPRCHERMHSSSFVTNLAPIMQLTNGMVHQYHGEWYGGAADLEERDADILAYDEDTATPYDPNVIPLRSEIERRYQRNDYAFDTVDWANIGDDNSDNDDDDDGDY